MSYTRKIFSTGAVRKTPARVIERILHEVDFRENSRVIEIGAGKGEITIPLKKQIEDSGRNSDAVFAFEIDGHFSKDLQDKVTPVNVITASAFDIPQHLPENFTADYIISSMPLSFYNREEIKKLLEMLNNNVRPGGKILILYHAFWLSGFLRRCLPGSKIKGFFTLPPYFLLVHTKK